MEPDIVDALLRRHLARKGLPADPNESNWKIERSKLGGRGLIATRDINQGDIIFIDAPLVIGPRCYNKYLPMCINCYKTGCPLFPCDRGCGLPVCSNVCEDSEKHAKSECNYLRNLRPTCGSMWSMELLQAVVPIRALSLDSEERRLIEAFECHPRHVRELDLLTKNVENDVNQEDATFMNRVCRILDTGAFETAVLDENSTSVSLRALYPIGALQNHCCLPNTRHHFNRQQLLFTKAAIDIKKGEEITMTYTDLMWDTTLRRQYLKLSKHFDCACKRCSDPLEFGTCLGALRCANLDCFGNMFPIYPLNTETSWTCEDCSLIVSSRQIKSIRSGLTAIVKEILYKTPRRVLNFVKGELTILVPSTSYFMMDMKFRIVSYFGRTEGLEWENLTNEELRTKVKFCQDLVSLLDNLGCGDCQKKGLILYEWYCTETEITKRSEKSEIENQDFGAEIDDGKGEYRSTSAIFKMAVKILKDDIAAPDDLSLIQIVN